MRVRSLLALVACGGLFGLSYIFVRVAAPQFGPFAVTAVRTVVGGAILAVAGHAAGHGVVPLGRRYVLLGVVGAAAPFTLIAVATTQLDAGTSAMINATSPAFAILMGAFVARRPPALRAAVGMVVALSGIVVVVAARGLGVEAGQAWGVGAGLAGAAVFAYGGFFAARHFAGVPALVVASGQQIGAAVVLVPLSAVLWAGGVRGDEPIDGHGVMNLLLLGVLGSGLAYLLFYWLIDREGPVATANVNLLVPLSGVGWSAVFLDEPLTPVTGLGVLVTIAGLALILTPQRRPEIP